MNSRFAVLVLLFVFIFAVTYSVLAQWDCPFRYDCGKRQVKDEIPVPRRRLVNHLRLLRSFLPRQEETRSLEEESRLGNIADPEGSWK